MSKLYAIQQDFEDLLEYWALDDVRVLSSFSNTNTSSVSAATAAVGTTFWRDAPLFKHQVATDDAVMRKVSAIVCKHCIASRNM
jgi:hypothetical protein